MRHLILGSSGQLGGHLKEYLLRQGEEVIEFDIKRTMNEDLRVRFNKELYSYIGKIDFVHFLAFDVGGAKYLETNQDKFKFIQNNMYIMSNTFEFLNHTKLPFIFASSQHAELNNSYGVLKALGEKMTYDIGGTVIRFWNIYGIEAPDQYSHAITDFIHMARTTGVIQMRTTGEEHRQMLYSDDASECMFKICSLYDTLDKSQSFGVSSFKWVTIKEIAQIIADKTGAKVIAGTRLDQTQQDARNEGNDRALSFWQPTTSLDDGIQKMINAYDSQRKNP